MESTGFLDSFFINILFRVEENTKPTLACKSFSHHSEAVCETLTDLRYIIDKILISMFSLSHSLHESRVMFVAISERVHRIIDAGSRVLIVEHQDIADIACVVMAVR